MKKRFSYLLIGILTLTLANAQPPKIEVPQYSINSIPLPSEMNNQVCISGMKFYDGKLYFASERCPIIFVADPSTGKIVNRINLKVSQEFEMEGLSSYKDKLYLCLLYTSDAADERSSVDLGGRRIIKKKKNE